MFHWVLNTSPVIVSESLSEFLSAFSTITSLLNQEGLEAIVHRRPLKLMFLKISQYSHKSSSRFVSLQICSKETPIRVFSYEQPAKFLRTCFFYRTHSVAVF